jgi:hypothetical protein
MKIERARLKSEALRGDKAKRDGGGGPIFRLCPAECDENVVFVNKVMSDPVIGRMIARRMALALQAYRNFPRNGPETLRPEDRRKFRPSGGAA